MKTAISLPDDTYEQATRQAEALGISRSEFFARAARSYLDELPASIAAQIVARLSLSSAWPSMPAMPVKPRPARDTAGPPRPA